MRRLKSQYIKKAILFPLIIVILLTILAIPVVPRFIQMMPRSINPTGAVLDYDESDYYLVNYKNFGDLRLNNFVGWLSSDDIALGCAITYKSEDENTTAASLLERSSEPWNDGTLVIVGDNTDREFRNLHKATINNEFTIEFHKHDSYTYAVKDIVPIVDKEEINKYMKDSDAILCLPYNDFSKLGSEYFYTIYLCDQVK